MLSRFISKTFEEEPERTGALPNKGPHLSRPASAPWGLRRWAASAVLASTSGRGLAAQAPATFWAQFISYFRVGI